jgi:exosortase/archaeosortase family protein
MADAAAAPVPRARLLLASAVAAALSQIVPSARIEYADDLALTVAIAWLAALVVAWDRGPAFFGAPRAALVAVGAVASVGAVLALAAAGTRYHAYVRVLPLVAGAGWVLAAVGVNRKAWAALGGVLLLLALPAINPPPKALHAVFDPVLIPATTWLAAALHRVMGSPVTMEAHDVLRTPHGPLVLEDGCSGLWAITRLGVLAALVVTFFPTSARQRALLAATAILVGFASNAWRIAVLAATVLDHDEAGFDYWHQGSGATLFAVATSVAAALVWWLLLRRSLLRSLPHASPRPEPSRAPPSAVTR